MNKVKTWQIYLVAAIILAAIIGIIVYSTRDDSNKTKNDSYNDMSDKETPDNLTDINSNNANNNQPTNNGQCVRTVDNKAMQEQIDIKNKFVVMTIKGYGDVKIQLFDQDAPLAVENFLRLTKSGYYDCVAFHRIIPGFVVQGGDPTGTGSGGDSAFGKDFTDELNPNTPSFKTGYVKGVLAMANRGPNTNSSQFFFCLQDLNQSLGKLYTIFGKVVSGQDIVDKIGLLGTAEGKPQTEVMIEKAVIADK